LLSDVFNRHKIADCFRVGSVVLIALDIGLYIGGGHEFHLMPQRDQFPRPIVRRRAGLHDTQAGFLGAEKRDDFCAA
jgi:hypothetical protein